MREYRSAARAEWLAEVAAALDQARLLMRQVESTTAQSDEWLELILRIEAARLDIRALQLRGRRIPVEFDPKWTRLAGPEENRTATD